ncbi:MAG: glutamine--fructose-6-phosphate transaminase (isomerizing) [Bacilli bacterium]|nr:glutamine--fructose-6-phosphate transaminase (isomerizing) [Bacilli bacterium]
MGLVSPKEYVAKGLKMLDYRGYDSAGIAYFNRGIKIYKDVGSVEHLMTIVPKNITANVMIGHTRWATHGAPTKLNTHPHISFNQRICLVHNGVIDNYKELKAFLLEKNYSFYGETDSEVVANLLEYYYLENGDIIETIKKVKSLIKGSYAITFFTDDIKDTLYVIKKASPLVIGKGQGYNLVASDASPMIDYTNEFIELEDKEFGYINNKEVVIFDEQGKQIQKETIHKNIELISHDLKGYPHYMLKEIEEVPQTINRLINTYYQDDEFLFNKQLIKNLNESDHIIFIGCGTSYHAGLVGGRYFEKYNKSTSRFIASEWAFHPTYPGAKPFIIMISQSGETADLIHCLRIIKEHNLNNLIITNTGGSTLDRNCMYSLLLHSGVEVSVASTKAYVAQVTLLAMLSAALVNDKSIIGDLRQEINVVNDIQDNYKPKIMKVAKELMNRKNIFYLGRSFDYFLSLEASLKLKEISYIHSEAIPGGELKHGPIALIEKDLPVIVFITDPDTASSMRGNIEEVKTRGAKVYVVSTKELSAPEDTIVVKDYAYYLSSVAISSIAFYLAYYVALDKGLNVDKPRNLAKSVTVE